MHRPSKTGVLYPPFGVLLFPHHRDRRDGALLGQRHHQRAATAHPTRHGVRVDQADHHWGRKFTSWIGGCAMR